MQPVPRIEENPCRPRHFRPLSAGAPVVIDERHAVAVETCRARLVMVASVFAVVFLVVALRLLTMPLFLEGSAEAHAGRVLPAGPPLPSRADIVDRNGQLLATTLSTPSLYADTRHIPDPREATRAILSVLPQLNEADVYAKLSSGKSFVWIRRRLTPTQQYQVNRLGIPGLQFINEERRIYPYGDLASHVVGFCGIDNNGLAGIERALDDAVKSSAGPLQLSLDARVQFIVHDELTKVIDEFRAKGGAGIVMDVNTGEIIAMVSLPDFDPNHPGAVDPKLPPEQAKERIFNKITLGVYEMGSVFKIFNTAMALDAGVTSMTKGYDASRAIRIGRFTIDDYHGKNRWLSTPEIFMYSSNIGSARMAVDAGAARQRDFLGRLGMLQPLSIELDEVGKPHYPPVKNWKEIAVMTIAYGHGISVTPLHLVTAVSAVVNGGIRHPPTLRKVPPGATPPGERVMSQKTSENMRKLMRLVVQNGTAKFAAAPGYVVGGKTGTAEKNSGGRYQQKKLLSSFVGVFPMHDPKYAILIMVDEPRGTKKSFGYATAGWTAAPASSRIIQRIGPILGVQPVDEASPAVVRALTVESLQGKRVESY
ncbi:MAG TPA: penicillin-binding protein 2 [Stellaceae bacterium]|nr:penicillin-binding protein 2 [Stellaceae bacterium]